VEFPQGFMKFHLAFQLSSGDLEIFGHFTNFMCYPVREANTGSVLLPMVLAGVYVRISLPTFLGTFQKSSWESSHKRNYRLIFRVISFYQRVVPCSFRNSIGVCFTFLLTGGSVPALSIFVSPLMRTGFPPSLLVYVDLITAFCQISRESKHFGVEYHRCSELLKKYQENDPSHVCE
jgi:hypothetical protein